jgi:hypothetical protein
MEKIAGYETEIQQDIEESAMEDKADKEQQEVGSQVGKNNPPRGAAKLGKGKRIGADARHGQDQVKLSGWSMSPNGRVRD